MFASVKPNNLRIPTCYPILFHLTRTVREHSVFQESILSICSHLTGKSRGKFFWDIFIQIPFFCPEVSTLLICLMKVFLFGEKNGNNMTVTYCLQISLTCDHYFLKFLKKFVPACYFCSNKNQEIVPYWTLLIWNQGITVKCHNCKSSMLLERLERAYDISPFSKQNLGVNKTFCVLPNSKFIGDGSPSLLWRTIKKISWAED